MKKNPKAIAGIIGIAVTVALLGVLIVFMVPTVSEVQREMSLTPTPIPPMPDTVWAERIDPDAPTVMPTLRNGSTGELVWQLQTRLAELGYYTGAVDGEFGNGTKEAVIDFQKNNGLDADGMAGTETWTLLFSDEAKRKTSNE